MKKKKKGRPRPKPSGYRALACLSLAMLLAACAGPQTGVIASLTVGNPDAPLMALDTDMSDIVVGHADVDATLVVSTKTGVPVFVVAIAEDRRLVYSRSRDFRGEYRLDEPVPPWVADVVRPERLAQLGLELAPTPNDPEPEVPE